MNHTVEADAPVPFGYKCSWLAIRSPDPQQVIVALDLVDTRPSSWQAGVEAAYHGNVFVTPVVRGWVLVVSMNLPWPERDDHPDACTDFLLSLGRHFPDVQFFATHRVVETHAWARVANGVIVRQYACSGEQGEVHWDYGVETAEETRLRLQQEDYFKSFDAEEQAEWEAEESAITTFMPSESDVMHIASLWSIDPTALDTLDLEPSFGYVGVFRSGQ